MTQSGTMGVMVDAMRWRAVLLWLALVAVTSGCGDTSGRIGVTGYVAFSGNQPIDRGMIEFSPLTDKAMTGTGAPIVDGLYQIPRKKGLVAGKYRVRIYAPAPTPIAEGPPGSMRNNTPPKERVAARFNSETELTAEILPGKDQQFDFDVE